MADITEIIEESAVQLEIVESGGGQIEIVDTSSTQIEIVETTLDSSDLDISTQTNTLVVETTTDSTNVDIIVDPSTIVETTTTTNTIEITENQVIFQTGSTFINYYNSESVSSSITSSFALRAENAATASYILNPVVGETVKFQTQSNSNSSSLLNLVIKDYSNDVSVNVKGGSLELTFGSPSLPTISDINVESFDTNRFDLVNDSYILTPQFDLNGTTFIKGMLSSSTNGIVEFTENSSITISQETFPTYATGSHTFTINIITQLADNSQLTISTDKVLTLNKLNPSSPTITNIIRISKWV